MADRSDELTTRVERVETKVDTLSVKVDSLLRAEMHAEMSGGFGQLRNDMQSGFTRLEQTLDQFIDTQIQTNQIVDRRLRSLGE